jgi:hypothetical protein
MEFRSVTRSFRLDIGCPPVANAALISLFSLSTISDGVLAGAARPYHALASKPGRKSLTVGRSGNASRLGRSPVPDIPLLPQQPHAGVFLFLRWSHSFLSQRSNADCRAKFHVGNPAAPVRYLVIPHHDCLVSTLQLNRRAGSSPSSPNMTASISASSVVTSLAPDGSSRK